MSWPDLKHKLAGAPASKSFIFSERLFSPEQKDAVENLK
jgi:hypothetical protein